MPAFLVKLGANDLNWPKRILTLAFMNWCICCCTVHWMQSLNVKYKTLLIVL